MRDSSSEPRPGCNRSPSVAHPTRSLASHHRASRRKVRERGACDAEQGVGGPRELSRMAWHARGQGFKSPQLHHHNPAGRGRSRVQLSAMVRQGWEGRSATAAAWPPARQSPVERQAKQLEGELRQLVIAMAPALLTQPGIGPVNAAQLLISWSHPGRFWSEAAFAMLAGAAPVQASSGQVVRHRLNRGGDRQLHRARTPS
jgi:transposase